ncbi:thiamine phosphate synthase [Salipiger sp. IMCC34102]|uniref:thiamine phosphate synthase n=1 Tax=Salipiger sp. IMCC34102 TaxID=2510647 RepID=UPI00101DB915|nr:thiamine phosphate synthase [Salipiger sp. IMCC34102]RYH03112.1 thiamine phosphate synthase [Salipiger sp. IMCC34102]
MTDQTDLAQDTGDTPQIYLITPTEIDLATFPDRLAACLDTSPVACLRMALATRDEDRLGRAADALRAVTEVRDVALVVERHSGLVTRHGLDGVHLTDGSRGVAAARKALGEDAIVGTHAAQSRHDGMTAAELGADYVSFGPAGVTALDDGAQAPRDLFEWWSQMIEVPIVAEGALDDDLIRSLAPHVDFFGLGDEIWSHPDPAARLSELHALFA